MSRTGSTETRLIVIRGNSGSGKSQLAHAIRAARPRGVAIIGHDVLRREILHVRDHPGALSVPFIDMTTRFALDNGLHVVVEGILHSESYGEMLASLCRDHLGITRCYYYNLELPETLRRHRTKKLADEVSEEQVASWYRSEDLVADLAEVVFDEAISGEAALNVVLNDVGWQDSDVS
jgi:predicted kinase